jgi:hypothetical protein
MAAWLELAAVLPQTPLFPVDDLARIVTFLTPLLIDQPGWRDLEAAERAFVRGLGRSARRKALHRP